MKIRDRITCMCLRCGQRHTNTVDWFIKKENRRCPACGGEIDLKRPFSEWVKGQAARIQEMISESDKMERQQAPATLRRVPRRG